MDAKIKLCEKIRTKTAKVAVIGLGYVGLPLAVEKARAGYRTIGFDIRPDKVEKVNRAENYIGDILDKDLSEVVCTKKLSATSDFSFVRDVDCISICVPTPLDAHQRPDISYVENSAKEIAKYMKARTLVILESTTYPGTTEELLLPILEKGSGLECGRDFFLAFSPERVDPGNQVFKTKNTPKVVGGVGRDSTEIAAMFYRSILEGEVFEASSPRVAEMEKLLENTYRNINIGLINEMAIICHKMNINVWEVIEAAKTKPYGFQAFYPGAGVGGHCIPLDPYYLSWKAREYSYHTQLIETSAIINDNMPAYIVERIGDILNRFQRSVNGARILILGVAYKQDIDDYRESPALKVIELLERKGALVEYYDPYIPFFESKGRRKKGICALTTESVAVEDLVVITTKHTTIDYQMVCREAKYIFDTKNALADIKNRENIEVL